jgi:hypothetical protein
MSPGPERRPTHGLAKFAFVTSLVAVTLAFYGSLFAEKHIAGSPLRQARGSAGLPTEPVRWWERLWVSGERAVFGDRLERAVHELTSRSPLMNQTLQVVAYFLPFVLGLLAAFAGGNALTAIEKNPERGGDFPAVFAIMIGGFAAVIAGCMILSQYLWPLVPSLYG